MDINSKLCQVFAKSLDIPVEDVTPELTYNSISEWDSTAHMILIAEIENDFDIMLDTDDIIEMSSVKIAEQIVAKYVEAS